MIARTLIACLACVAALSAAGPAHAAFPGPNGNITAHHVTTVCGDPNPCRIDKVRNTSGLEYGRGSHPAWSADGQRLAFVDGNDIYTVKPDGSDRLLVFDGNMDVVEGISWAPSGDRLAAALGVCDLDECRSDIHVIVLGPSGPQSVVNITPDPFSERNPAWSPHGDRIAFDSMRDGNNDVFTMDVDGGNLARLTTNPAGDSDPNWAPSGDALAFTSGRDSTDVIYTMNLDGTAQTRRSHPSLYPSQHPAWSPDGTRIVFSGVRGEITQPQLVVITADGSSEFASGARQGEADYEPDWQPANITYVRPTGRVAAQGLPRAGVRALCGSEPYARPAARVRLLQPAVADIAEHHRRHPGRQRSGCELDWIRPVLGVAALDRARRSRLHDRDEPLRHSLWRRHRRLRSGERPRRSRTTPASSRSSTWCGSPTSRPRAIPKLHRTSRSGSRSAAARHRAPRPEPAVP